jgi:hypothetical protein
MTTPCALCAGLCPVGLYTLPTRDHSRRTVCAGCYVAVETDPQRKVDAGIVNGRT